MDMTHEEVIAAIKDIRDEAIIAMMNHPKLKWLIDPFADRDVVAAEWLEQVCAEMVDAQRLIRQADGVEPEFDVIAATFGDEP